jgi:hypothetical protein
MKIIIEGIDRLGKDTLIKSIVNAYGYHQVLHYQKPESLDVYSGDLFKYQAQSFITMFEMLNSNVTNLILNRAHLGETVYAPRYRKYDGSYVFDLERKHGWPAVSQTRLVLLYTSDFSFITDDGQSFDFASKEQEQADFKAAFFKSAFRNKVMVDVSNGAGGFKSKEQIFREALRNLM